jgi:CheY-like chemotaxis protein/HPt (histidine-containing phosphotransfer) domain-containing protein
MENFATESYPRQCGRILLAEDFEVNQKVAQLLLQKAGFKVDVVANGQQAVAAHQKNRYDLILMDIQMPVMDGLEATKRIRSWEAEMQNRTGKDSDSNADIRLQSSEFKRVPIIAMTGDAAMNGFDAQRYPGMDDCLCKPLQRVQLLSAMTRWIDSGSNDAFAHDPAGDTGSSDQIPARFGVVLDLDRAIDEFMGKKTILFDVLDRFTDQAGDQIDQLRNASAQSDYQAVASAAHRIKGGAANLRADRLAGVAADLEKAAGNQNAEVIRALIDKLAAEFHCLAQFLSQNGL